jgi:NADP-reducing hydrogenase subunit HndC
MLEILEKITEGRGEMEDIGQLEFLSKTIMEASLCALGQTAPNPVLSTIKHFRDEYETHIRDKKCPAHVCQALVSFVIDPVKCKGCTRCAKICPTDAISGVVKSPFVIDQNKCIKCGECVSLCKFDAIIKE